MLQMGVDKFGRETDNDPEVIVYDLALILRESGIAPVLTVDRADGKKVNSSLQLPSSTGRAMDKAQAMHLSWVVDSGKYTPFLEDLSK